MYVVLLYCNGACSINNILKKTHKHTHTEIATELTSGTAGMK